VITLELGELVYLGVAQLGLFLLLVVIATGLILRVFRGIVTVQDIHIKALSARLETEVGEMRKMVESLTARVRSLEWYIASNDLPVPSSDEQAREFVSARVQERAVTRAMAQPIYDVMTELKNESARLRKRPSQQLHEDIQAEIDAAKNKRTL
jgi:hypothetical protein